MASVEPFHQPNKELMASHLDVLFSRAMSGKVEITSIHATDRKTSPKTQLFDVDDEAAIEWAAAVNQEPGWNVYVGAAVRKDETQPNKAATDNDFLISYVLFADADTPEQLEQARSTYIKLGLTPPLVVITGRTPHKRAQFWWPLEEPIVDVEVMRSSLRGIANALGTDPKVCTAKQIMRLAGSISWPKDKEGRIIEQTQVIMPKNASRCFYLEQINNAFPPAAVTTTPTGITTPTPDRPIDLYGFEVDGREDRMTRLVWARVCDMHRIAPMPPGNEEIEAEIESLFDIYLSKVNTRLPLKGMSKAEALEAEGRGITEMRHKFHAALKLWDTKVREHAAVEKPKEAQKAPQKATETRFDPETGEVIEDDEEASQGVLEGPGAGLSGWTGVVPPPRPWAYADFLMRQAVTAVAAPPGVGKTTFSFQLGLAFAQDMQLGDWTPVVGGGGKVWLYNNEEPKDELDRRFLASCIEAGSDPELVARRFSYTSGLTEPFTIGGMDESGSFFRSPDVDRVKRVIRHNDIKLFIADPLVEFHTAPENNNDLMKAVGGIFREIAVDCDCSVLLFHHTPKSAGSDNSAGEMNSLRGGGALVGQARFVYTIFAMSKQDARDYGVKPDERPAFVRWDWAKSNMAPMAGEAMWWRKVGVGLGNEDDTRPQDHVGVLRRVNLTLVDEGYDGKTMEERVRSEIEFNKEVVATLVRYSHVSPETACPKSDLVAKVDREALKLPRKAVEDKAAKVFDGMKLEGYEVRVVEQIRGSLTVRKYYVVGG